MGFRLKNSGKVLFDKGKVNARVFKSLILEAFKTKELYAENKIIYTRLNYEGKIRECEATYKELWDAYRGFTGKEDFHPYDKSFSLKDMAEFVKAKYLYDTIQDVKSQENYILHGGFSSNYHVERSIRFYKSLEERAEEPTNRKKVKSSEEKGILCDIKEPINQPVEK